jgi:hypothetical protein
MIGLSVYPAQPTSGRNRCHQRPAIADGTAAALPSSFLLGLLWKFLEFAGQESCDPLRHTGHDCVEHLIPILGKNARSALLTTLTACSSLITGPANVSDLKNRTGRGMILEDRSRTDFRRAVGCSRITASRLDGPASRAYILFSSPFWAHMPSRTKRGFT